MNVAAYKTPNSAECIRCGKCIDCLLYTSEIVYDLEGQYDYFTTYVGTDKNFDMDSTTIKFRILADGKEVYKSDVIRKDTPAEFVSLDIKGVKRLVLIADDVDGNLVGDFASWADTKLYQNYSKPVIKGDDVIVFNTKEKVDLLQGLSLIHIFMYRGKYRLWTNDCKP